MKRLISICVSVILVAALLCPPLSALAAEQPQGYWPYLVAYQKAVESGNVDEILKTGDALLNFYAQFPMNEAIASTSYNVYYYRFTNALFERRGNYDAAIDNAKKLLKVSEYIGFTDAAIAAKAAISKLDPMTEVYALSGGGAPYYGAKHEPLSGAYFGRVVSMDGNRVRNAAELAGESIASVYVEVGGYTAQDFSWIIGRFDDGKHALHIALNFPGEEATAAEIVGGKHDRNITESLEYLAKLKSPVFLRIGAEMNLWEMDPALFKNAYIHVARLARDIAPNAALVWSPNCVGHWGSELSDYYPGDQYVDWVGTSLYSNITPHPGRTETDASSLYFGRGIYADCVLNMRAVAEFAMARGKPVIVSEGGTGIVSKDGKRFDSHAAAQMFKMFGVLNMVYPNIKAIVYFDVDLGTAAENYKYAMTNSAAVAAAHSEAVSINPTLLTSAGQTASQTFVKLSDFSEKTGRVEIRAYSDTLYSDKMTVTYYLSGKKIAETSALPYTCFVDTSSLPAGLYEFKAVFNDGAGYTKTKTYTLTKLLSGVVSFTEGYDPSAKLDVPSDWAQEEVALAVEAGLVPDALQRGYTENITRLDFCRLVITLIERKTGKSIDEVLAGRGLKLDYSAFTDTKDKSVLAAFALGIVSGRGGGVFDGASGIVREEAAKMLANAAAVLGINPNAAPVAFSDAGSFSAWAVDAIAFVSSTVDKVSGKPVMGGVGEGLFSPRGSYTRQQAFITMLRLYRAS